MTGVTRIVARGGEVVLVTEPAPEPRRGEVLVATRYSVISPGTERTILAATRAEGWASHEYPEPDQAWPHVRSGGVRHDLLLPRPPSPDYASLGYSVAGRVLAAGEGVADLAPGDLVACGGSQCAFHSDVVAVPRNLVVRVPGGLGADRAAFVTLGSIALEALRRSERTLGETIAVFGCGVLGVLITMLARAAGMYVVAIDPDPERREVAVAAGAVPADAGPVGNRVGGDLPGQVRARTDGFGADAAIITVTTESSDVVNAAVDVLRPGGVVVGVGQFGMGLGRDRWFGAQATILPSIAYGPGRYDPVYEENNWDYPINVVRWTENRNMAAFLRLAADGRLDLDQIPVMRVPAADAARAYAALAAGGLPLTGLIGYPGKDA
jgi:threonine dehydrogenase-like Zn-dependent dehydrogenase